MGKLKESKSNRLSAIKLGIVSIAMLGFGYLLVPLYDIFCDITGLNGKTGEQVVATELVKEIDTERLVRVDFDGSVNSRLSWRIQPQTISLKVHPGELITTSYLAANFSKKRTVGRAVPSVSPGTAASHFMKTECFCFTEQLLEGGESRDMPVTFMIDPELPKNVNTVTLSYTFYPAKNEQLSRTDYSTENNE